MISREWVLRVKSRDRYTDTHMHIYIRTRAKRHGEAAWRREGRNGGLALRQKDAKLSQKHRDSSWYSGRLDSLLSFLLLLARIHMYIHTHLHDFCFTTPFYLFVSYAHMHIHLDARTRSYTKAASCANIIHTHTHTAFTIYITHNYYINIIHKYIYINIKSQLIIPWPSILRI